MRRLLPAIVLLLIAVDCAAACPDMRTAEFRATEAALDKTVLYLGVSVVLTLLVSRAYVLLVAAVPLAEVWRGGSMICQFKLAALEASFAESGLHICIAAIVITLIALWRRSPPLISIDRLSKG